MLQVLKEDTSTKYFIDCKSKGVYNSKLVPLYTVFFLFVFFFFCFSAINAVPRISDVQVCFKQKHIVRDGQK